jgi:hypothetical protein
MRKLLLLLLLLPFFASAQLFTDASANLPATAGGPNMDVRAADLDGDGDLDLVFAREGKPNFILRNNGAGVFVNATQGNLPQPFNDSEDVAIADFNRDGFLDLVFCSEDDFPLGQTNVHEYYWGDGTGKFTVAPFQFPDSEANAVIAGDLNGDDAPDVIFGNKGVLNVLINDGKGLFTLEADRLPAITRTTQDIILFDADGDGDNDLMAGNENGNLLFINRGEGYFADSTETHLPQGLNVETRKIAVGDVDADGDLDIFLANVAFIPGKNRQNRLFLNNGQGRFADVTAEQLPIDNDHTIDAIFEDVDLDNDPDLVLANVFGASIKIYENDGQGRFFNATLAILGKEYFRDALGVIAADLNGDGYRDLYFCHRRQSDTQKDLLLLRNMPVSTGAADENRTSISVFPNPVRDHFFIRTQLTPDSVQLTGTRGEILPALPLMPVERGIYRCNLPLQSLYAGAWVVNCFAKGVPIGQAKVVISID